MRGRERSKDKWECVWKEDKKKRNRDGGDDKNWWKIKLN